MGETNKTKIAIIGLGNVGRGVMAAIQHNPDMELALIASRDRNRALEDLARRKIEIDPSIVYQIDDEMPWQLPASGTDVAILCGGSAKDLPKQAPYFAFCYNTVDSFDTHAKIPDYFAEMDLIARKNGNVSIISAGWDPGTFSLERVLGTSFIPNARAYTFWGPGVSQGHSDALRKVEGVADAIQYTMPIEDALGRVRKGENPQLTTREKHWRDCHVALKPGADPEKVREAIVTMPNYFADYETKVTFETQESVNERKKQMPHGGFVMASGNTGFSQDNKAMIEYRNQWGSNPEATGNILVACARAVMRLKEEGKTGAFTMLDIPPAYYSPCSKEELLKNWM